MRKDFISNKLCKIIIFVTLIVLLSAVLFACDSDNDSTFAIVFEVDGEVYRVLPATDSTGIRLLSNPSKEGLATEAEQMID